MSVASTDRKVIDGIWFPTNPDEAKAWEKTCKVVRLHRQFLLIAVTRIEGKWKCYGTPVPGKNHDDEIHLWKTEGVPVDESIARAAFDQFANIPYAR